MISCLTAARCKRTEVIKVMLDHTIERAVIQRASTTRRPGRAGSGGVGVHQGCFVPPVRLP